MNLAQKLVLLLLASSLISACGSKPVSTSSSDVVASKPVEQRQVFTPAQELNYRKAIDLAKQGKQLEAKAAFEVLLQEAPSMSGALVNLGIIAVNSKEFEEARDMFDRALAINPKNPTAYVGLSDIDSANGDFKSAAKKLERAIGFKGDYWVAHYKLGVLYDLYLANKERALKHYRAYVSGSGMSDVNTVANWVKLLELEQQ